MLGKQICSVVLWLLLSIFPAAVFSQTPPDSLTMPEVEITGKAKPFQGMKMVEMDSLVLANNRNYSLAELLTRNSTVFIKNYGPGALALPSFRGTAAGHTKLYWNGLPLTSPMLGVADFNLVPVFAVDAVELQYGNAGLQQGSGGFGGNISMQSVSSKRNELSGELMQSYGSFGLRQTQFRAGYGKKIMASTRIYHQKSDNDFLFINTTKPGLPKERQKNAAYRQYGWVQTLDGEIREKLWFSAAFWYQEADKQLPPLLITANNNETQYDASARATFQLRKYAENTQYFLDAGYSREKLDYDNLIAGIHSRSIFQRYYIYPHLRWKKLRSLQADAGLQAIADEATSPKYNRKGQQRVSIPVNLQYAGIRRLQLSFLLRPETFNFQNYVLSYAAAANVEVIKNKKLDFYSNIGRNYNYPTLNDLYWYPGGNPNLQPENALSAEAGCKNQLRSKNGKINWQNGVTFFTTTVDNYIQWQPGSGGFWTPQNLKKVWSRGTEISSKTAVDVAGFKVDVSGAYSYVRSTSQRALSELDKTVGRQLIYVPVHTAQMGATAGYGKSIFSAQYIYTQRRNTPTYFLPAYSIVNLQLESGFTLKNVALRAFAKCNNLLDVSYQAIEFRAMPGRWFELGAAINFTQKL